MTAADIHVARVLRQLWSEGFEDSRTKLLLEDFLRKRKSMTWSRRLEMSQRLGYCCGRQETRQETRLRLSDEKGGTKTPLGMGRNGKLAIACRSKDQKVAKR
jgi:hypothetical protein